MNLTEHKRGLRRDANSNTTWIFPVIPSDGMYRGGVIQSLTKPMKVLFCCRKEQSSCFQGTLAVRPRWWYSCKLCTGQVKKGKSIVFSTNAFRSNWGGKLPYKPVKHRKLTKASHSDSPHGRFNLADGTEPHLHKIWCIYVLFQIKWLEHSKYFHGIFAQVPGLKGCVYVFLHLSLSHHLFTWHSSSLIPNAETVARGLPDSSRVTWMYKLIHLETS